MKGANKMDVTLAKRRGENPFKPGFPRYYFPSRQPKRGKSIGILAQGR